MPGTADWARIDPGHDGSLYFGRRTEGGAGRSQARVSPVRTGLQARGHTGAKKGGIKCQDPGSRNAFGPVGENARVPEAFAAFAGGDRAREEIAPHVLLKAQQGKGLWGCAPAVLTKACYGGIGVEALDRGSRSSLSQPQLAPPFLKHILPLPPVKHMKRCCNIA